MDQWPPSGNPAPSLWLRQTSALVCTHPHEGTQTYKIKNKNKSKKKKLNKGTWQRSALYDFDPRDPQGEKNQLLTPILGLYIHMYTHTRAHTHTRTQGRHMRNTHVQTNFKIYIKAGRGGTGL